MKKQIIILATAIMPLAFFSCSKEKVGKNETNSIEEEIAAKPGGGGITTLGNLSKNLECLFQFNGNLVDATGKLPNGVPNVSGADIYTDDRNGSPNSAIKFDGRYGVDISNIPYNVNKSVAAWVKYEPSIAPISTNYLIDAEHPSPDIAQEADKYIAVIPGDTSLASVQSNPLDGHWHFLVATYDGTTLKFYVDGGYVGSSLNINSSIYPPGFTFKYHIGYFPALNDPNSVIGTWNGSMDDFRFYTRILSAADVQKLYNL